EMNLKNKKVWIAVAVGVLIVIMVVANLRRRQKSATKVQSQKVVEQELRAIVSASGKIRPKINVDISATASGKVVKVGVDEGDIVEKGQFLLQIDPTAAEANVRQIEASIAAAKVNFELDKANLRQLEIELKRQEALFERSLTSEDDLQKARTAHDVQKLQTQAREQEIQRLQAMLLNARHELAKVNIQADIAGVVTKRNIEEGENVFVGAFNNPATVLLTIADLSVIEAEIEVDETDIVDVRVDQEAIVKVDAYPDSSFKGVVTKVGRSPILSVGGTEQQATSFEVIVQLIETIPNVRPGLSCKAEITTGYRDKAVAVPIQALTLRKPSELKPEKKGARRRRRAGSAAADDGTKEEESQGVFVINDGKVEFHKVKTGIAGDRFFEVLSGLEVGDEVVIGPFKALRRLRNSDPVKVENKKKEQE
ncbi:MAG: efflux RND transporter periplasmic adaptor subunit, partial [bacterium]